MKEVLDEALATRIFNLKDVAGAQDQARRRARCAGLEPEQVGSSRVWGKRCL